MRLLLIRHGESSANAEGRLQGRLDFSLSERGRRESERLAGRLAQLSIAALYASPLRRAYETAETVGQRLGIEIFARDELMERDVGAMAGLTREEIIAQFPEYARARIDVRPVEVLGFEGDEPFAERVARVIAAIVSGHPNATVAVVTHGGVIGSYVRQSLEMPLSRRGPFAIDNASITTFEVDEAPRPRVQIVGLNDTCHLDVL
jgi:probable phosphoglycerate mutase